MFFVKQGPFVNAFLTEEDCRDNGVYYNSNEAGFISPMAERVFSSAASFVMGETVPMRAGFRLAGDTDRKLLGELLKDVNEHFGRKKTYPDDYKLVIRVCEAGKETANLTKYEREHFQITYFDQPLSNFLKKQKENGHDTKRPLVFAFPSFDHLNRFLQKNAWAGTPGADVYGDKKGFYLKIPPIPDADIEILDLKVMEYYGKILKDAEAAHILEHAGQIASAKKVRHAFHAET